MKKAFCIITLLTLLISCAKKGNIDNLSTIKTIEDLGIDVKFHNIVFNMNHPLFGYIRFNPPEGVKFSFDYRTNGGNIIKEPVKTLDGEYDFYIKNLQVGDNDLVVTATLSDGRELSKSYNYKVIEGFGIRDIWDAITKEMTETDYLGTPNSYHNFAYEIEKNSLLISGLYGDYSFKFNANGGVSEIFVDGSNVKLNVNDPFPISNSSYRSYLNRFAGESEAIGNYFCHYYGKYLVEYYQYRDENNRLVDMGDKHVRVSINPVRSNWP